MKRSLKELVEYHVEGKDGVDGIVKDFLFEEENWTISYLHVSLPRFLKSLNVHIPRKFLKKPDWASQLFPVDLTKDEIENSPEIEKNLPISKIYEEELNKYYDTIDHGLSPYIPPVDPQLIIFPSRPVSIPKTIILESEIESKLRSFDEVIGYHIQTLDGEIGHLEDLIIDDVDWQILYAVLDTRNFVPWSKKVLISIEWMEDISFANREIKINLTTERIKSAPEFDYSKPVNIKYEESLYDYYGRSVTHH